MKLSLRIILFSILYLLSAHLLCSQQTLHGRLVDADVPEYGILNATIQLFQGEEALAATTPDSDGYFVFTELPDSGYVDLLVLCDYYDVVKLVAIPITDGLLEVSLIARTEIVRIKNLNIPLFEVDDLTQGQTFHGSRLKRGLPYSPPGIIVETDNRNRRRHIKRLKREVKRRKKRD